MPSGQDSELPVQEGLALIRGQGTKIPQCSQKKNKNALSLANVRGDCVNTWGEGIESTAD